jgi:hypothetical protein
MVEYNAVLPTLYKPNFANFQPCAKNGKNALLDHNNRSGAELATSPEKVLTFGQEVKRYGYTNTTCDITHPLPQEFERAEFKRTHGDSLPH